MVKFRVPASSANLGPGFDCLSAALSLSANFSFEKKDERLMITGCPPGMEGSDNLIYQSYLKGMQTYGLKPRGLSIHVDSDIPTARGLGSSAACVIAGLKAAAILHDVQLSDDELLLLACAMEGHPDNVAAALYGGARMSVWEEGRVISRAFSVHNSIRFLALIPDFSLSTHQARSVLKELVPLKDAVFNLSRTALLIKALEQGDMDLLLFSCQDRLHQPLRNPLIKDSRALVDKMNSLGAACCISGAGPTLLCMYLDDDFEKEAASVCKSYPSWQAKALHLDLQGLQIQ